MRPDLSAVHQDHGPIVRPHLVVKRGHRGRYRFMMIYEGERIGGEVWVDVRPGTPDVLHAFALAKITRLAEALQAGVGIRATLGQGLGTKAEPSGRAFDVDEAQARCPTILGAGDHHGEV